MDWVGWRRVERRVVGVFDGVAFALFRLVVIGELSSETLGSFLLRFVVAMFSPVAGSFKPLISDFRMCLEDSCVSGIGVIWLFAMTGTSPLVDFLDLE